MFIAVSIVLFLVVLFLFEEEQARLELLRIQEEKKNNRYIYQVQEVHLKEEKILYQLN